MTVQQQIESWWRKTFYSVREKDKTTTPSPRVDFGNHLFSFHSGFFGRGLRLIMTSLCIVENNERLIAHNNNYFKKLMRNLM